MNKIFAIFPLFSLVLSCGSSNSGTSGGLASGEMTANCPEADSVGFCPLQYCMCFCNDGRYYTPGDGISGATVTNCFNTDEGCINNCNGTGEFYNTCGVGSRGGMRATCSYYHKNDWQNCIKSMQCW